MEILQIGVFVVYIVITFIRLSINETWTMFERKESLDGKICDITEIVFRKILIFEKASCLMYCANHFDCKSVFHSAYAGDCVGCNVSYGLSDNPTRFLECSQYYHEKSDCPSSWSVFENSCYLILDEKMTFLNGLQKCESLDARPVIIGDENENNFIKELIHSSMDQNENTGFFTGFTDIESENTWVEYGTNNPMTFKDWGTSEPNMGNQENCLALYFPYNLKWVDISCDSTLRMICEINK